MPNKITRAYIRQYRDNKQIVAYVEWSDGSRTEGPSPSGKPFGFYGISDFGPHMGALLTRALMDGLTIERQVW
jgi:hypothetical protein